MSTVRFEGVFTALCTPFKNGEIDRASYDRLLDHQLAAGINGLVINGTTGESPCLGTAEVELLFQRAREKAGDSFPLLVGTGSNSTAQSIVNTKKAAEMGADLALVVVPYYNKPPQRGLTAHFTAIAEASDIPIMLYNVPGRTITGIEVDTLQELAQHPNIIGVKEASGQLSLLQQLQAQVSPEFILTSGDDPSCVAFCQQGGHGVISVMSNLLPTQTLDWIDRARKQDQSVVGDFARYQDLIESLYLEPNPIPIKTALQLAGIIDSPEMRLPLASALPATRDRIQKGLAALGLFQ